MSIDDNANSFSGDMASLAWYDPYQGKEIARSPYLIGKPVANSLNFVDINNNGQLHMIFGTDKSMYMTE